MNLGNIQQNNDLFYLVSEKNITKDASYYSLLIGLRAYFETYYDVSMELREYCQEDEKCINDIVQDIDNYIKSYINIAIHIQHFFELEIKRILENEHVLFAVDTKGDPIITHKLLNNIQLQANDTEKLKSIEFSDAVARLRKLVNNNIIVDDVAKILINNEQALKAINFLRNTTLHRGRRLMKYCSLDMLFVQNLLPLIKEIIDQPYYVEYKKAYNNNGIYEIIGDLIKEGKVSDIDYPQIALLKEIGRCKLELESKQQLYEYDDKEYLEKTIEKKVDYSFNEIVKTDKVCPCCNKKTIIEGYEFMGYDMDELGDEMDTSGGFQIINVPDYEKYYECVVCGFKVSTFVRF